MSGNGVYQELGAAGPITRNVPDSASQPDVQVFGIDLDR